MFKKRIYLFCFFLMLKISVNAQNLTADSTYKNSAFLDCASGKLNLIKISSEGFIAVIHYQKGNHIVGRLINGKEEGAWYQYNRDGIIRKKVFFMNGSASQVIEYDRKGKLSSKTNITIDF